MPLSIIRNFQQAVYSLTLWLVTERSCFRLQLINDSDYRRLFSSSLVHVDAK